MKYVTALALAVIIAITLAACGGNLSQPKNGTYKNDDKSVSVNGSVGGAFGGVGVTVNDLLSQTWTFSGKNEITLSMGVISAHGTYRIDGDKLYVTASMFGSETTSSYTITEIKSKSFFIDGAKFVKQ